MSRDTMSIHLVSSECEEAIGDETDVTEMLRKAFKSAKHHWMVIDPDPQMRGALNAVLIKMGEQHPDRQRLVEEIELLSKFNAWLIACQLGVANTDTMPSLPHEGWKGFGINQLWKEVT